MTVSAPRAAQIVSPSTTFVTAHVAAAAFVSAAFAAAAFAAAARREASGSATEGVLAASGEPGKYVAVAVAPVPDRAAWSVPRTFPLIATSPTKAATARSPLVVRRRMRFP
ncbi:hypothetical protein GCM10009740_39340 [Terrabacter terrae]|uniref:Secreted protein n=1 Tax=Terrabacter terrae TaxID=318434 RepID=A0ABN1ZT43_9MICO